MDKVKSNSRTINILLSVFSLIISLALAELAAGFIGLGQTYHDVVYDFGARHEAAIMASDYLPYTTHSSLTSEKAAWQGFNELGYRGAYPKQIEKPEGTYRILLLGDSFTYGWKLPVENSFAYLLQARLTENHLPVEVINAGFHDSYSPDAYYAYLAREGLALQPDIVVVNLYISNDVDDLWTTNWRKTDQNGGPTSLYTLRHYVDDNGSMHNPDIYWYYRIPLLRESRLFTAISAELTNLKPDTTTDQQLIDKYLTVLNAFDKLCEDNDITLYVTMFDVDMDRQKPKLAYEDFAALTVETLGSDHVLDLIGQFPAEYQIEGDGHFNWLGHQRYELFLYQFIQPTLRTWDPAQVGPLTPDEFGPVQEIVRYQGRTACGGFSSFWGTQFILPQNFPDCEPYLPYQVEVACLSANADWIKDNVRDEQVEETYFQATSQGYFQATIHQSGTCGIFPLTEE